MTTSASSLHFDAAADEYLSWLQVEANRSLNTVRAYRSEISRLGGFLAASGHPMLIDSIQVDDLRAYQRRLAQDLKSPASRARALVAIRSWLRWLAREGLMRDDLSNRVTVPRVPARLPKPMSPDELMRLLASLPSGTPVERRDRALVHFLVSTGCRISEALSLDRGDVPKLGNRLVVTGKGDKQRSVYLTQVARTALDEYLAGREDACLALFLNYDRSVKDDRERRLTPAGARHIINRIRRRYGIWSFRSPHVARHTAATTLLDITGGDVRLVQEILGHANLATLQGYTRIVDARKQDAYRRYDAYLEAAGGEPSAPAAASGSEPAPAKT